MDFETLLFDVADGIATITINRPDAANAMNPVMAKELRDASSAIVSDTGVRSVLITGAGKMFCAGGDLGTFAKAGRQAQRLMLEMAGDLHMALSRLARGDAPVVAAVNGTAAGAGFSLVMACDLVVCAQSAVFTMAYTRAGLAPDGSSTYTMPRKIGDRRARELMLTNRVLNAEEAADWCIVNRVVADSDLADEGRTLAAQLASGPTLAFGAVKTLLNGSFDQTLESQMELEAKAISGLVLSGDGQEGINAFLEKRKPDFKGA